MMEVLTALYELMPQASVYASKIYEALDSFEVDDTTIVLMAILLCVVVIGQRLGI